MAEAPDKRRGRITQTSIDAVLQRADLADLAAGYTQLRKQGAEHVGRCPFHDERTPSFWVNPGKGVYHCFGCGASGDVIGFLQAKQQLDFVEAIEYLADRYRVTLEYEDAAGGPSTPRVSKRRLYELSDAAAGFYEQFLHRAPGAEYARDYLTQRHISADTARAFRLGCSPEGDRDMASKAEGKGFTRQELLDARLIGAKGNKDFFRGRLMVPIIDRADRVIGFGARKLRDEQFGGKYVNSSDGPLFHKKQAVFLSPGIAKATRETPHVIVVEGYMDVIAMWQAGFRTTCAVMGTALTEQQVIEIKRLAPRAYFAFDPDAAGQVATLRALEQARTHELDVRVVLLPEGEDPADVLHGPDGRERMIELIDESVSLVHYRVSALLGSGNLADEGHRERIWREGVEFFGTLRESPEKQQQVDRFAFALGLDQDMIQALRREVSTGPAAGSGPASSGGSAAGNDRGGAYARGRDGHTVTASPQRRSPRDSAILRLEKELLGWAIRLRDVEGPEPLRALDVPVEAFMLDAHRRAWVLLLGDSVTDPLAISAIRDDAELVALAAHVVTLVAPRGISEEARNATADAAQVTAERAQSLLIRWIDRQIGELRTRMDTGDEAALEQWQVLEARRRALNPRTSTEPLL